MSDTGAPRYRIRPAREADVPELCSLLSELFAIESDFAVDRTVQRRGLTALLSAGEPHAVILVAEQRGEVIGMASCQRLISTAEGGPVGLVEDVVVRADRRGLGIGAALLDEMEQWAARFGLKRLQLLADADNPRALDFYQRRGWAPTRLVARRKRL